MAKLLRITEVHELTGVSVNTLRYWRANGTGPRSARLGKNVVYRQVDVDAWIEAQFANAVGDDLPAGA